jgi:hypothetical protein
VATREQLYADPVVQDKYKPVLGAIKPKFNVAIKKAENNPRNFGVLSEEVSSPDKANKILNQSIDNNYWRWLQTSKDNMLPEEKFVDFMQQRWAPIGAKNDPKNLNKNWAPNVRKFLKGILGNDEYNKWEKLNLVKGDKQSILG